MARCVVLFLMVAVLGLLLGCNHAITTGERRALEVPAAALVSRGQIEMVFVAQADKAALRLVRSGRSRAGAVEILSGLDEAERVVVTHPSQLTDGQLIEVRQ